MSGFRFQTSTHRGGTPVRGRKASAFFFLIFLLIGLVALYVIFVRPAIKTLQARDWNAVPCTILSSRVSTHSGGDDGNTYSVDIAYSYKVAGREYRANRYHFVGGSSSGREGKQKIVDAHPPGVEKICYVNPADPTDAVLHRNFSPEMFFGLIPLIFVVVGAGGIIATIRPRIPTHPSSSSSPIDLKPQASPVAKFIAGILVSIFWNGIVSVFVFRVIEMWRTGQGMKWFLSLFLVPFLFVGLAMIAFTVHSFFGLFSPRVRLRIGHLPVALGESVELSLEFSGRVDKLRDIRLQLEGREEQDARSGKNRRTNRNVFYTADIAHFTNVNDVKTGNVLCTIPTDHPPTDWHVSHRTIWVIRLKAEVELGADLNDEYPIAVTAPVGDEVIA